jgi:hypothetical protein
MGMMGASATSEKTRSPVVTQKLNDMNLGISVPSNDPS